MRRPASGRPTCAAPGSGCSATEGQGLEAALLAAPGVRRVSIPQSEAVESLNVGVAAAVCLYEQLRQRVARTPVRTAQ